MMGRHGKGLGLDLSRSPELARRGVRSVSLSKVDIVTLILDGTLTNRGLAD